MQFCKDKLSDTLVQNILRIFPAMTTLSWAEAECLAKDQLLQVLTTEGKATFARWQAKMRNFGNACKWVKKDCPIAAVLQNIQGETVFGAQAGAAALHKDWEDLLCAKHDGDFRERFAPFLPNIPEWRLPPITADDLLQAAQRARGTAGGLDADLVLKLPENAIMRLAELLNQCESFGEWPPGLLGWKVVFIPKTNPGQGTPCPTMKVRPCIYRLWSATRVCQIGKHLQGLQVFPPQQAGGIGGLSCPALLLERQLAISHNGHTHGISMDFEKAFDRCDWSDALWVATSLGIPSRIIAALKAQFRFQFACSPSKSYGNFWCAAGGPL